MRVILIILCILAFVYGYTKLRANFYNRDNWVYKLLMALVFLLVLIIVARWI